MKKKLTHFTIFLTVFQSGCAVGPDFKPFPTPNVPSYTENVLPNTVGGGIPIPGGEMQEFVLVTDEIPGEWWELFHSPELNDLIIRGLYNNPNLQAAEAALRQAQSLLWAQIGGTLIPAFAASFIGNRQQIPDFSTTLGLGEPIFQEAPGPFNTFTANVGVTYTLDVFGGLRRSVEYYGAQVDYQRYELLAAYLSLTTNIVTTAIAEASLREQIRATQDIVGMLEGQLDVTAKQFYLGGVAGTDVLTQQAQLEQTRALIPGLEKQLAQTRSALAILVGDPPGATDLPQFDLDKLVLPTELPISIPSAWIKQRPDVAAAEALVHGACAQIGVATANMLPSFSITGNYGDEASSIPSLFGVGTSLWNIQGQVTQVLFNGGALWFKRKAAIQNYETLFAQYRQTVLTALKNVSDTLNALEQDARLVEVNALTTDVAWKNYGITQKQYDAGGVSYLSLLTAQQQYTQAYLALIQAKANRYADTAALFQAMGGGWWNLKPITITSEEILTTVTDYAKN